MINDFYYDLFQNIPNLVAIYIIEIVYNKTANTVFAVFVRFNSL